MATVRMTLDEIVASGGGAVDRPKLEATTEDDIRRHMVEDGFDPDDPFEGLREIPSVAAVRAKSGLSQDKFAKALRIPVATLRGWEQGRRTPDPVAISFFALVANDLDRAFQVLAPAPPTTTEAEEIGTALDDAALDRVGGIKR